MDDHDEDSGSPYDDTDINDPDFWDDAPVVHTYTWEQAEADGQIFRIFESRWEQLSGGKPILATIGVSSAFSLAACQEVWNEYAGWRRDVEPTLAEEDKLFSTTMNDQTIWVIEDGLTFVLMLPEEY